MFDMPRKVITTEIKEFILANYLVKGPSEISEIFRISKGTITSFMLKHNLRTPREVGRKRAGQKNAGKTSSTPETDRILESNYLTIPVKKLSEMIGRSDTFVNVRLRQLGLIIPEEIIEQRKIDSRLKKGHVPNNKGKKMSAEQYEKAAHTMFKKGNLPVNTKFDGHTSIRIDSHGHAYKHIRVGQGKYELLHRKMWIDEHGPIPRGFVVAFKNGDTLDVIPENLMLISKKENMIRNSIHNYPEDIKSTIRTLSKLKKTIRNYEKQQSDGPERSSI